MAIDTTKKLVSAMWKALPIADADVVDSFDRSNATWNYSGFTFGLPVPIAAIIFTTNARMVLSGDVLYISLEG